MSSPTSTKLAPPTYLDPKIRRRNVWWYILFIWLCLVPVIVLFYWLGYERFSEMIHLDFPGIRFSIETLYPSEELMPLWVFGIIAPLIIILGYFLTVIWTALLTKVGLTILNLFHPPKEGVFYRNIADKDYVFWNRRNFMRLFLFWLLHSVPITWGKEFFSYRLFGITIGKGSYVHHCWISPEFVSIGKNVTLGQASGVYSFQFEGDKLLVAKVTINDNVIVGPQSVILPGSIIESDIEIEGNGFCHPFTHLVEKGYYSGQPFQLVKKSDI